MLNPAASPRSTSVALALLAIGACSGGSTADDSSSARSAAVPDTPAPLTASVVDQLRTRLGDATYHLRHGDTVPSSSLRWAIYHQTRPGDEYARVVWVVSDSTGRVRWVSRHESEYVPHTMLWRDLSGDGLGDVIALSGQEETFESRVFLQRRPDPARGDSTLFRLAYEDTSQYATLVDLDGDGRPEVLDPVDFTRAPEDDAAECSVEISDAVTREARGEYERIGRPWHAANFTYGIPDFAVSTLMLLLPLRIVQFDADSAIDATSRFPDHVRWRLRLLEQVRDATPDACRAPVDSVVTYWRRLIR